LEVPDKLPPSFQATPLNAQQLKILQYSLNTDRELDMVLLKKIPGAYEC
jgi:hypothetical protein